MVELPFTWLQLMWPLNKKVFLGAHINSMYTLALSVYSASYKISSYMNVFEDDYSLHIVWRVAQFFLCHTFFCDKDL